MSGKDRRNYMMILCYTLLVILGLVLIIWGYESVRYALYQMQQISGLSINYSPAFGIMGMGVVIICIGPIHYFCQQRTK